MVKAIILGASGYTGAELVRLVSGHSNIEITGLSADRKAGLEYCEVFPHLRHLKLPSLKNIETLNFSEADLVFCALPHTTSQKIIKTLPKNLKIVDLSADFRLRSVEDYKLWYGVDHQAVDLQKEAVYGLTEFYREDIKKARLVACTGCNAAAGMYPLIPLIRKGIIDLDNIIISLATGVSGAGRKPNEAMLHSEVSEGFSAYNVACHRHLAEFDQEFSKASSGPVKVSFTPHLLPQNRGILATIFVRGDITKIFTTLTEYYMNENFVHILPLNKPSSTKDIRGSNFCHIGIVADRINNGVILFSALDNLIKGSAGQAVQNANLMFGFEETSGLLASPIFP